MSREHEIKKFARKSRKVRQSGNCRKFGLSFRQIKKFTKNNTLGKLGSTWRVLGLCWRYVGPSCDPKAHENHILWPGTSMLASERPTWAQLGPTWAQHCPTLSQLSPTWSHLWPNFGANLTPGTPNNSEKQMKITCFLYVSVLASTAPHFAPTWPQLGHTWAQRGTNLAELGPTWPQRGPNFHDIF